MFDVRCSLLSFRYGFISVRRASATGRRFPRDSFGGGTMLAAMPRFVRWLWLAAFVLGGGQACFATPWADVPSDRVPEPSLRTGTLPNGLRWVILPNAEPKGRVSLRLLVAAGSLVEHDEERGLAHFIEHMAFRGSRAFPGNQLTTTLC